MSRRHPGSRFYRAMDSRRWAAARRFVLRRDGFRCRDCRLAGVLEVHHVRPLAKGGDPYDVENLRALCRGCHIVTHRTRTPTPAVLAWRALVAEWRGSVTIGNKPPRRMELGTRSG